jgi:hypothetical protein
MTSLAPPVHRYAGTLVLFVLLVAVDLLFVLMHVLHAWSPLLDGSHYALDSDRGMAEIYQYIKFVWLSACLVLALIMTGQRVYVAWIALFVLLLVDDAMGLHENAGTVLAQWFGFSPALGLRAKDFGEVLYAAILGGMAVVLVVMTFWRGSLASQRVSADLLCLLCGLAFFGVFFDTIHTIAYFKMPGLVEGLLTLVEDGGEMLVVSAMTAYAFDIASHGGQRRIYVWDWVQARIGVAPAAS